MTNDRKPTNSSGETWRTFGLLMVIVFGMFCAVSLARWIDARRPQNDPTLEEEQLYVTANAARRMSLGFNGLIADWYWMRSLQYVGRKFLNAPPHVTLDNLGELKLLLLAPMLDTATTLDPEFIEPYEYAAVVLPAIDVQEAIRITRKGIAANPNAWRLYHQLGYIYWQKRDFSAASDVYGQGASIPGAPSWMQAMKARMAVEGGSRSTAREIYAHMYEQSNDDKVREMARRRLMQLDSFDEQDAIRKILVAYKTRTGHCAQSWTDITPMLRAIRMAVDASGAPLDPGRTPYTLLTKECDVELDYRSEVPIR
jgi:tetratricopeptide (TPR) repeat protein